MRRLAAFLFALAAPAYAATPIVVNFDPDSSTEQYPIFCTPGIGAGVNKCPGDGWSNGFKIATSGSSTTVTAVDSTQDAFAMADVGDLITFVPSTQSSSVSRIVATKASADSITVDSAVNISVTGGATFRLWKLTPGTGATNDGWWRFTGTGRSTIVISVDQVTAASVDYTVQCRHTLFDRYSLPVYLAGTAATPISVTAAGAQRVTLTDEGFDSCRVGIKTTTDADDAIVITSTTDDMDWKEYVNSYAPTAGALHVDFTEDAGGTPKACAVTLTAGTGLTGAAVAADLTAKMNAAACTPDNTYLASYSTSTHKFTIARATGTKTVDLLWQTGTNTATSAKTLLGYANTDDTGATTYAADSATGETTFTQNLDAGTYSGTQACAEIAAEMQATSSVTATYACTYDLTARTITISATGITQLMLLWNSGTNNATSCDTALGFAADNTGALTYTGTALDLNGASTVEKVSISVVNPEAH